MNNIILTSTGFSNPKIIKEVKRFFGSEISVLLGKKAVIITTASPEKERNEFALLAYSQLSDMGFGEIAFFDLEKGYARELLSFDLLYVNGGNTYYLLDWAKKSGFDEIVREFLRKGGLYIGVSAGSVIAGISIEVLNYVGGDENASELVDFSGLRLINKAIVPHYNRRREIMVGEYEKASGIEALRLTDGMAVVGSMGGDFYLLDDFWKKV